jgi:chromosome segregation ATPase
MTMTYDDWKTEDPYTPKTALEEARMEIDRLNDENDKLENDLYDAQTIGNRLIVENAANLNEIARLRAALEEILDECKEDYDVDDDETGYGAPHPNKWMRLGQMIEEALHGKGYVG